MQRKVAPVHTASVVEFLSVIKVASTLEPKTPEGYTKAFRMIVAQIADVPSGKERFDYRTGGHKRWLDVV